MKSRIIYFLAVLIVCLNVVCAVYGNNSKAMALPACALIKVSGEVDFALSSFIKRSARISLEKGVKTIIFDIDTFGGRVDSALDISKTITGIGSAHTIAYISEKAISAGALIALSCNEIIMKENTTIGDCAPIIMSKEGPQMLGEKFQSPLRAEFRKLAGKNGYPIDLAEAMVSSETEVFKVTYRDGQKKFMASTKYSDLTEEEKNLVYKKETVLEKGKLLTMHSKEALELGFASKIVTGLDELLAYRQINRNDLIKLEFEWPESTVRFLDKIAPILVAIGLLALYTEIKAPGFGLPGIISVICFALIFVSKFMAGLANYPEISLFIIGVTLIIIEVFVIPGFGIAGMGGIVLIIASLYLASQPFVVPQLPWQKMYAKEWFTQFGLAIISFFVLAFFITFFLPKLSFAKRIGLTSTLPSPISGAFTGEDNNRQSLMNKEGIALSVLRPCGKAKFDNGVYDVISDSGFIEKGIKIKVIKIDGYNIFVQNMEQIQ